MGDFQFELQNVVKYFDENKSRWFRIQVQISNEFQVTNTNFKNLLKVVDNTWWTWMGQTATEGGWWKSSSTFWRYDTKLPVTSHLQNYHPPFDWYHPLFKFHWYHPSRGVFLLMLCVVNMLIFREPWNLGSNIQFALIDRVGSLTHHVDLSFLSFDFWKPNQSTKKLSKPLPTYLSIVLFPRVVSRKTRPSPVLSSLQIRATTRDKGENGIHLWTILHPWAIQRLTQFHWQEM